MFKLKCRAIWWLAILKKLNKIHWVVLKDCIHNVFLKCIILKFNKSGNISQIKKPAYNDQLHTVTNNPTQFKQNMLSDIGRVVSTICLYSVACTDSIKSHTSYKICWFKIAVRNNQLNMETKDSTKFEPNLFSAFQGVASIESSTCTSARSPVSLCPCCVGQQRHIAWFIYCGFISYGKYCT